MFSVDLLLSLMEINGNEQYAEEKLKVLAGENSKKLDLYGEMMEMLIAPAKRSQNDIKSIKKIFSWCTYARQPLSVNNLQQILVLDGSLKDHRFDVRKEIQGKLSRYGLYSYNHANSSTLWKILV